MSGAGFDLLGSVTVLLSLALCLMGALVARLRRALLRERRRREDLCDGMVLRARDGRITDLSDAAAELPGARPGARLAAVLEAAIGEGREAALAALGRLVDSGEPMHLMVRRTTGAHCELIGQPSGGESLLVMRDARLIASELERAEAAL